ncbi:hypothetical protein [Vibrio sp. LaRot3]|uniref:hypothetical protein n=1 Tax=Vibrio sp. LaRot3 TaxID=2998829 RepID=UPI0022CE27FF|nr:hypothetical protein [Vibrio sp. LaRot3]MDA0148454.1 hypothetical protein [Vibrio sp. LaRot3]
MNSLLEALINQGYKAKSEANRISIRLTWATMPVFIVRNIELNVYELKLQHWRYVIVIIAFLFNALIGIPFENSLGIILWGSLSLLYLASVFLVHRKSRELQNYIDSVNRIYHS